MSRFAVVICAAGASARMGGLKKEYLPLPGGEALTVLGASVSVFASNSSIERMVITVPVSAAWGEDAARGAIPPRFLLRGSRPEVLFAPGGATRGASVYNALKLLASFPPEYVLIHDGARPWVSASLIERIMNAAINHGAAIPVVPLIETPKELENPLSGSCGPRLVKSHLKRSLIAAAQTPQAFRFPEILRAHEWAAEKERAGGEYTDDAEIWAECFSPVAAIEGEAANKKITFPEDIRRWET